MEVILPRVLRLCVTLRQVGYLTPRKLKLRKNTCMYLFIYLLFAYWKRGFLDPLFLQKLQRRKQILHLSGIKPRFINFPGRGIDALPTKMIFFQAGVVKKSF
jgi:hypothetical protein